MQNLIIACDSGNDSHVLAKECVNIDLHTCTCMYICTCRLLLSGVLACQGGGWEFGKIKS